MNGDQLNNALINRLPVYYSKRGKVKEYYIHGVQRLPETVISVVMYNRVGSKKTKVMELVDFCKNFEFKKSEVSDNV